jgi:hypothetical protein
MPNTSRFRLRRLLRPFLAGALLALAGCVAYSDHPLTDPGAQPIDTALIGSWAVVEEGEEVYLHIGYDKDTRRLRLLMVEIGRDRQLRATGFTAHTSKLRDRRYLNLKADDPDAAAPDWLIVKYAVDGDSLHVAFMNNGAAVDAIRSGKIQGEADPDDRSAAAHLTAAQRPLQRFVTRHDQDLFGETSAMQRLPVNHP